MGNNFSYLGMRETKHTGVVDLPYFGTFNTSHVSQTPWEQYMLFDIQGR